MINASMRYYDYFLYGGSDSYGMPALSEEPEGKMKIAIEITNQSIQDNINYSDCEFMGLTHAPIDDTYVISYGDDMLKVTNTNTRGRFTQVFMTRM